MDLSFTGEELAFRDEVRGFMDANILAETRRKVLEGVEVARDDTLAWHQILHRQGWGGSNGAKEYSATWGGPGEQHRFRVGSPRGGAPRLPPFRRQMEGPE